MTNAESNNQKIIAYKLKKDFGTILVGTCFHLSGETNDHYRSNDSNSALFDYNLKLKIDFVENNTEWFEPIILEQVQKEFFDSFMSYGENMGKTVQTCQEAWMSFIGLNSK